MRFKSKPEDERRTIRLPILFTKKENEKIRAAAEIRMLDVSDFVRRAALGRKADVRYEGQIILELREVVGVIRTIHKEFVERGIEPPEEQLRAAIRDAIEAMKRISK